MTEVVERFLRYAAIDTRSEEDAACFPSTEKQKNLARLLAEELREMGAADVFFDEKLCYVYAAIPANDGGASGKTLGFIAHMDTSPEVTGENVRPQFTENYDGGDIVLNAEKGLVLSPERFPELRGYVGKTLIHTDGNTLLGADDKAGVAEIMTMAHTLLSNPEIPHGRIAIAFTPDEEVGGGVDHFDLARFGADYAYTVDGGGLGELEYENFNAASADIVINGVSVHTGEAKNKLKNAALIAQEFNALLPENERPENTEGYEGFFCLMRIKGEIERAELSYLIRDHSREKFEQKKAMIAEIAKKLNRKYGAGTVEAKVTDSYYNMREKIEPEFMFLIDNAKAAMEKLGITPKILPIRGGTDGARLSYMGLPCPNICTGGHNFHGRYEFVCAQSMEKITELLVLLAQG